MRISDEGLEFVKKHEGVIDHVYLDPVDLPTVGVGHLLSPYEEDLWPVGTKLTRDQIDILLREDVREAEECVSESVTSDLDQSQFDALVSFVFNVGCGAFKKSTLLRLLNAGLIEDAAEEFQKWRMAKGKVLPGLVKRREAEKALFLGEHNI